jgi:hypothetical protein
MRAWYGAFYGKAVLGLKTESSYLAGMNIIISSQAGLWIHSFGPADKLETYT